ncbi:MAG: hypothetical protein LBI70_00910 [Rickettsiales bacterium]|jgi:hypothetical protein|nr:hypothetical protein [Rickettsiales bacterium]
MNYDIAMEQNQKNKEDSMFLKKRHTILTTVVVAGFGVIFYPQTRAIAAGEAYSLGKNVANCLCGFLTGCCTKHEKSDSEGEDAEDNDDNEKNKTDSKTQETKKKKKAKDSKDKKKKHNSKNKKNEDKEDEEIEEEIEEEVEEENNESSKKKNQKNKKKDAVKKKQKKTTNKKRKNTGNSEDDREREEHFESMSIIVEPSVITDSTLRTNGTLDTTGGVTINSFILNLAPPTNHSNNPFALDTHPPLHSNIINLEPDMLDITLALGSPSSTGSYQIMPEEPIATLLGQVYNPQPSISNYHRRHYSSVSEPTTPLGLEETPGVISSFLLGSRTSGNRNISPTGRLNILGRRSGNRGETASTPPISNNYRISSASIHQTADDSSARYLRLSNNNIGRRSPNPYNNNTQHLSNTFRQELLHPPVVLATSNSRQSIDGALGRNNLYMHTPSASFSSSNMLPPHSPQRSQVFYNNILQELYNPSLISDNAPAEQYRHNILNQAEVMENNLIMNEGDIPLHFIGQSTLRRTVVTQSLENNNFRTRENTISSQDPQSTTSETTTGSENSPKELSNDSSPDESNDSSSTE